MNDDLEPAILNMVSQSDYRPIKPKKIAKRLHQESPDEIRQIKRTIKRMVHQGKLAYGANHLIQPIQAVPADQPDAPEEPKKTPSPRKGEAIVGIFRRAEGGFGFVRPRGTSPGEGRAADIYIPQEKTGDAASGDTVAVRIGKGQGHRGPGPRGEIVEVLERETHQFVGTYRESLRGSYVEIDGAVFASPISVGDPGAHGPTPGDKVVIEMVRFPSHVHRGEGAITEVLGPRGKPGVDTLSILREYDLPEAFPEDVLEDARRQAEHFDDEGPVPPGRHDATEEVVITIDPADARDFDDAISLVLLDKGHWLLGVHIADVSHFVRPKSHLDREARERATSVYLPDRVIPMIPETISNSLASLQPGRLRYTKTAYLEFNAEAVRVDARFHSAAIKSRKRLTYEQVDAYLQDPGPWRKKWGPPVCELLDRMRQLASILRRRRIARGALELNMPEVKIDLDKHGRITGAHVVENTESHQIIEEFMLAANEATAEMLRDKGLLFLRRVHRPPSPLKLKALSEFLAELGLARHTESGMVLEEAVPAKRRGKASPATELRGRFALQKLLNDVAGRPEERAVHYAVLRSMQRAVYSPEEEGHYALASDCYCHFTSPIRRYPDLTVHRLLDAVLTDTRPRQELEALVVQGEHCSDREHRAESAERELTKLKLLAYLSDRVGEEMDGIITGVENFGLFIQGIKLPAEGFVHVDSLVDDDYRFDRTTHSLTGYRSGNAFRLGDVVRVAVARVDLDRRELDFRVVAHRERDGKRAVPKRKKATRAEGRTRRRR